MLKNFTDVVSRILAIRDSRGLTTIEFARQLKMTPQTVDLYLKGERKPSLEFLFNVCSTFGESADSLLGLAERREHSEVVAPQPRTVREPGAQFRGVTKMVQPKDDPVLVELAALKRRVAALESSRVLACG